MDFDSFWCCLECFLILSNGLKYLTQSGTMGNQNMIHIKIICRFFRKKPKISQNWRKSQTNTFQAKVLEKKPNIF